MSGVIIFVLNMAFFPEKGKFCYPDIDSQNELIRVIRTPLSAIIFKAGDGYQKKGGDLAENPADRAT
ncbi:hypothetical protein [Serratia nevei]|uniref:hypothetical protein n=1 Tax=Serratia nevei TaxID=2703794 RepID=UPI0011F2DD8B|nr:hypothetical protein [Serratia nevei]